MRRLSFLAAIALTGAFALLSSTMAKTPALPLFARALGAPPSLIGWAVMASTVPGIIISLPAGLLRDRLGARPLLIAALFVFATAPFLYLLVHTIGELAIVRFYHGFATAIFGTVVGAEIAARYPQSRGHALGVYSAVSTAGRSVAPFLGGALISATGFPGVYIGCAAAGVLALGLGLRVTTDHAPAPAPDPSANRTTGTAHVAAVLADRVVLTTSLIEALQYLVFGSVEAFLAVYAAHRGWPAWTIGVLLGTQLGIIVLFKPRLGALSDRLGRRTLILVGLVIGVLAVAALPFTASFPALLAINAAFGLGFAATTAATGALVADRARAGGLGASMGVLRSIMDIGQATGPVLTGALIGAGGYRLAFLTLAALLALGAMGLVLSGRPGAPSPAHP
ncbi:MFS transporter [Acidiferrobacter sp.]|uniref:MFS transporter n=1 Tax=Acidiferrobacter sp. TaxID=1872107 RepID=UPI002625ADF6|nr:MFS transporter [Acidiferrobacter sp.]